MQIQTLQSITQNIPNSPPHFRLICLHSDESHAFILYGTTLNLAKLLEFQQSAVNLSCVLMHGTLKNAVVLLKGKWLADFIAHAHDPQLDIAKLDFDAKLSEKGLLVMDMDSTAIQIECIDEIAKLAGTGELVSPLLKALCVASSILNKVCVAVWVRLKARQKAFCNKYVKIAFNARLN